MRKIILFMHTSLDGFVATKKGEINWIKLDEKLFDLAGEITAQSDTALYGRVTYQMMENYWPTAGNKPNATKHDREHSKWYNTVTKVVLSKTMKPTGKSDVQVISDNVPNEILKIKKQTGKSIVIFGSPSVGHSLTQLHLIDAYWLLVNPVLLGEGIPLFKNVPDKRILKLIDTKKFDCGVAGLHYITER